jgi:hypothetical protein
VAVLREQDIKILSPAGRGGGQPPPPAFDLKEKKCVKMYTGIKITFKYDSVFPYTG